MLSRLIRAGDEEDGDALDDTELRDQLVTLLLAGHETTATALAWALYELGRDPALLARSREAAPRPGDDAWLDAVLKESMRLHPVIPMVVRTLMQPATIGGWTCPPGTTVGPSIIVGHGREDNHPDPEVFRPGALPRPEPAHQHLDPVRGRRPPLHRRRLLADGGRRGPARGAHGVRRHGRRRGPAPGPQHHQRPAPWCADPAHRVGAVGLRVVGAGPPRTGTESLSIAFRLLLGERCAHMRTLPGHPFDCGPDWRLALAGRTPDWEAMFAGHAAGVDWPFSLLLAATCRRTGPAPWCSCRAATPPTPGWTACWPPSSR